MAKRDYYDILGVSRSAGADEIKKAHRKLVRKFHPDANKHDPQATQRFHEAQEAYDVLSDPGKRRIYDQFGHAGVEAGGRSGPAADPFAGFRRGAGGRRGRQGRSGPVGVEDFEFGAGDFTDVFEQLFGRGAPAAGRGARPAPQPTAQRGADVEHPVTLTFEQAARGTTLPLQISRDGRLETIDVKIPSGVRDGSRVRIRGRGQQAGGAEAGDLFILTRIQPHAYFRREGLDIVLDVPISMYEALMGTRLDVPTLEGPVTLTIPPGTSSGTRLRIKGRGVERSGERGDQHVVVRVLVPKGLDAADQKMIEAIEQKHPINARSDVPWAG
jgi:DnaJ-class molecular chaperone